MRYELMPFLKEENEIEIHDLLSVDWESIKLTGNTETYVIPQSQIIKPYLIAELKYQNIGLEDVLFLLNNIENPLELISGQEIGIPELGDIENFIAKNRK